MEYMDTFYSLIQTVINTCLAGLMLGVFMSNALASGTTSEQIDSIRIEHSNLKNAKAEFDAARNRGELNETAQNDYLVWIRQLSDQLARDCATLTQGDLAALPNDLPCEQILSSSLMPANINLATEQTKTEQTNGLLDELNASIGEFDERLLQEQARVKAQTPPMQSTSGGGGGSEAGSAGSEGAEQNTGIAATTGQEPEKNAEDGPQAAPNKAEGEGQNTVGDDSTPGTARPGDSNDVPENIPDGSDDDVVARQLREAAEKETDPELKKKLWEEYRRYKEGTG
jgi:hypothetical protein